MPFGEYIPYRRLFQRLSSATALVPRDAIPGHGPGVIHTPDWPVGVVISYEIFFPDRTRAAANVGGRILLVPTNAASYTYRPGAGHGGRRSPVALPRAGRGRDPGCAHRILHHDPPRRQSRLGDAALLRAQVPLRDGRTPYTRTGDWPVVSASVVLLALGWTRLRARGYRVPGIRPTQ